MDSLQTVCHLFINENKISGQKNENFLDFDVARIKPWMSNLSRMQFDQRIARNIVNM